MTSLIQILKSVIYLLIHEVRKQGFFHYTVGTFLSFEFNPSPSNISTVWFCVLGAEDAKENLGHNDKFGNTQPFNSDKGNNSHPAQK